MGSRCLAATRWPPNALFADRFEICALDRHPVRLTWLRHDHAPCAQAPAGVNCRIGPLPPSPDALLDEFSTWHTDPRNRLCHDAGLPLISFAVLGGLAHIQTGLGLPGHGPIDLAMLLLAGTLLFDLAAFRAQALGVLAMGLVLWGVGRLTPLPVLCGAFVLGWAFQLVGHRVYEGNKPAFTTNVIHLVVGPRWLVRRWTRCLISAARGQS